MTLHIASLSTSKIMFPYVEFVNKHFNENEHWFLFCSNTSTQISYSNAETKDIYKDSQYFLVQMRKAKKIILHGIWYDMLCEILSLNPSLFKKTYWAMWGGDFYFPEKQSLIKKRVIEKMGTLVTSATGDYALAKKWYGAKGKHIKCFHYPSNLYKEYNIQPKEDSTMNIQLGNSADPTNNHIDVLNQLIKYKDKDIKIFSPLSYGDMEYAKKVIKKGNELFEDKFIALTEFIPFQKYLEFLSKIDIAIFAHKRQQAFGNALTLLGMGKKVYLDKESTLNAVFEANSVKVYDVDNVELSLIDEPIKELNIKNVKERFSEEALVKSLSSWIN